MHKKQQQQENMKEERVAQWVKEMSSDKKKRKAVERDIEKE